MISIVNVQFTYVAFWRMARNSDDLTSFSVATLFTYTKDDVHERVRISRDDVERLRNLEEVGGFVVVHGGHGLPGVFFTACVVEDVGLGGCFTPNIVIETFGGIIEERAKFFYGKGWLIR